LTEYGKIFGQMTESQIFSRTARPNSVNKHFIRGPNLKMSQNTDTKKARADHFVRGFFLNAGAREKAVRLYTRENMCHMIIMMNMPNFTVA